MGRGKRQNSAGGRLAVDLLAASTVTSPPIEESDTIWYRLHSHGESLDEQSAWSEPLYPPSEDSFDDPDEYEYLYGVRSGYSCYHDPHHLVSYLVKTDLRPKGNDVVMFRGRQTGHGIDGEPLVLPEDELERWTWEEFQSHVASKPEPPHQLEQGQHDYDPEGEIIHQRGALGNWCSICCAFVDSDTPEADHQA